MYTETIMTIPVGTITLEGALVFPEATQGIVIFAHGTGSGRLSPRNNYVARVLQRAGIGTLLIDLLTREEDEIREMRFDIDLLTERLLQVTRWVREQEATHHLIPGYFGASTGAAAALRAGAALGSDIGAIVSRGGRPDLAGEALTQVQSPTLLLVGGDDELVIRLNREAYEQLTIKKDLKIIPGATHLFEEPGTLEQVAELATAWFKQYLGAPPTA